MFKTYTEKVQEAMLELNRYIYGKQLTKDDIVEYISILFGEIKEQPKRIEKLIELIEDKINEAENCDDIEITDEFLKGYINGLEMAKTIVEEKIYLL